MRFNPRARLDSSQVTRGGRGGGGLAVGGGLGGLVLVLAFVLLGGDPSALLDDGGQPAARDGAVDLSHCRTGADANRDDDCAKVAVVNSLQAFWAEELPRQTGRAYRPATMVLFTGGVTSACGQASSATGPFYCPADEQVYLDSGFFDEMLEGRLGARGGDFAEAYVVAHEYGHHVENVLGLLTAGSRSEGAGGGSVRTELMADCLAGVWTAHVTRPGPGGQSLVAEVTQEDLAEAIDAAEAVGDDRIQRASSGEIQPDLFTHGTAEQRARWFERGRRGGSVAQCNAFEASRL